MSRVPGWLGRAGAGLTELSKRLEARRQLELGLGLGQVEPAGAQLGRDVGEQLVDRFEPERRQHPLAIPVGVGSVRHGRQPAEIRAS